MDTDGLPLETLTEKSTPDNQTSSFKLSKRAKPTVRVDHSNGAPGTSHVSLLGSVASTASRGFEVNPSYPTISDGSTSLNVSSAAFMMYPHQFDSMTNSGKQPDKIQRAELTTGVADDESDDQREQRIDSSKVNGLGVNSDRMVSSVTTSDGASVGNDIIEIHEFSLTDIDAYLDIYFEVLNNRLRHFIGQDEEIARFRLAMKNRITSDSNAREHQNVLLGKMHDEVVAAVLLSFPEEASTISNEQMLTQSNSCFTSIRRWMVRKANYIPQHAEECYIEMIGVKSAYQNHGIGAAMLECVEHIAVQTGARLLTIHSNSERLEIYLERFGFLIDHSDKSTFWKRRVEQENINKMLKTILPSDDNVDNTGSYINESMADSLNE